jgi:hypothetical protein
MTVIMTIHTYDNDDTFGKNELHTQTFNPVHTPLKDAFLRKAVTVIIFFLIIYVKTKVPVLKMMDLHINV